MTETHSRNQDIRCLCIEMSGRIVNKNLEATSETAINTQLKQGGFPNSLDSLTLTDVCGHSASGSTDLFLLLHKRQSTMNSLIHFKMKLLSKLNDFE